MNVNGELLFLIRYFTLNLDTEYFKCGDMQNIVSTKDQELNNMIYGILFYVIIRYRGGTKFWKQSGFLTNPVQCV